MMATRTPIFCLILLLAQALPLRTACAQSSCVLWGDLRATLQANNKVNVWWKTTEQRNTTAYQLEYSPTRDNFKLQGEISGLQNYQGNFAFELTHEAPSLGSNFYRLKHIAPNGDTCYSAIISLAIDAAGIQSAIM